MLLLVYSLGSVQYYLSYLVGFLIIEMVANLGRSSFAMFLVLDNNHFLKLIIATLMHTGRAPYQLSFSLSSLFSMQAGTPSPFSCF